MQTISIIISEKTLKKIFMEVIDRINKVFTYKYEIIDEYSNINKSSSTLILDGKSLAKIASQEIKNQKLFIINDSTLNVSEYKNRQFLISAPFRILDLFNHVENSLDQTKKREQKKIRYKQHIFDPLARVLHKDKKFIKLTEKECEIFLSLTESENKYLSKKYLLQKVWKYSQEIDTHTLETHLYSLRKKIDKNLGTKNLIIFEEKKGYLINRDLL